MIDEEFQAAKVSANFQRLRLVIMAPLYLLMRLERITRPIREKLSSSLIEICSSLVFYKGQNSSKGYY